MELEKSLKEQQDKLKINEEKMRLEQLAIQVLAFEILIYYRKNRGKSQKKTE